MSTARAGRIAALAISFRISFRRGCRAAAAAGLLALTACAGPPPGGNGRQAAASPDDAIGQARADPAWAAPDNGGGRPAEQRAATAPDPDTLVGMTRDRITGLLGEPVFVRRDPPAEFWRYRHVDCVLELIFYDTAGEQRLSHLASRGGDGRGGEGRAADARCLAALIASRPHAG